MELVNPRKEYQSGDRAVYSCQYHVVFTTKYCRPVLTGAIKERLAEIILEKCRELSVKVIDLIIQPDYVHLLLEVPPKPGIIKTVTRIKNYTASHLRQAFPELRSKLPCLWTYHKFISTAGSVELADIHRFLAAQQGV